MRTYIDVSNYPGITDMNGTHCVMDGKLYKMRVSRYDKYTASIPYNWLFNKVPCILANRSMTRLVFSYPDKDDTTDYTRIKYIGQICTCYDNGTKVYSSKGGGYGKYIERYISE